MSNWRGDPTLTLIEERFDAALKEARELRPEGDVWQKRKPEPKCLAYLRRPGVAGMSGKPCPTCGEPFGAAARQAATIERLRAAVEGCIEAMDLGGHAVGSYDGDIAAEGHALKAARAALAETEE